MLAGMPAGLVRLLQLAGGGLLCWMGASALRELGRPGAAPPPAGPGAPAAPERGFGQAVLVNLLNPNVWIFWSLVGGPLLAGRAAPVAGRRPGSSWSASTCRWSGSGRRWWPSSARSGGSGPAPPGRWLAPRRWPSSGWGWRSSGAARRAEARPRRGGWLGAVRRTADSARRPEGAVPGPAVVEAPAWRRDRSSWRLPPLALAAVAGGGFLLGRASHEAPPPAPPLTPAAPTTPRPIRAEEISEGQARHGADAARARRRAAAPLGRAGQDGRGARAEAGPRHRRLRPRLGHPHHRPRRLGEPASGCRAA